MTTLHAQDPSDGEQVRPASWDVQLERLAASFELTVAQVREDWSLLHHPANANADVFEHLRLRHVGRECRALLRAMAQARSPMKRAAYHA